MESNPKENFPIESGNKGENPPSYIDDLIAKLINVKDYFPGNYRDMIEKYFSKIQPEQYKDFIKYGRAIRVKIGNSILDTEVKQIINQKMNEILVRYRKDQPNETQKRYSEIDPLKIHDAHIEE